ncbi:hypothetical protein KUTeg_003906 [Tegillarca granosa]|uniref:H/ACA ribonucleoprotein complex non-core subunit NAF1 n=1 Tax=Tegillarca granosa TaxID=220873 RepID=A0ABQ9FNI2_TEGGR|nr:hypothetical protein KUTeg_003906 [Tegillarca granosa]
MDIEVEVQEKNILNHKNSHRDEGRESKNTGETKLSDVPPEIESVEAQAADGCEKNGDSLCKSLDNPDVLDIKSAKLKHNDRAMGNSLDKSDTPDIQSTLSGNVENNTDLSDTKNTDRGINDSDSDTTDNQATDNGITTVKNEPGSEEKNTVNQNSENLAGIPGNVDAKLNDSQFNVIRTDGDMTSDSDSDSDSSSSSSSDSEDFKITQNNAVIEVEDDDSEKGKKLNNGCEDVRTKGELFPEELPPMEQLNITITDDTELKEIGKISSIVGILVIIQSNKDTPPLNEQTFVFHNRKAVGQIFEVFGPVAMPWYSIRFNSVEDVHKLNLQVGNTIYFAPNVTDFTNYVFVQDLKSIKGSDASWENNNEPPAKHIDYSDDEDEKRAKAKKRNTNFEAVIKKEVEEGSLLPGANPCQKQRTSSRPNKRQKGKMTDTNRQQNHNNKAQTNQLNNNHFSRSAMQDYSQGHNNSGTHYHGNCAPGFIPSHNNQSFTQRQMRNSNPFQNTRFTHRNNLQYFHTVRPRMQNNQHSAHQIRWPQAAGPPSRWSQPPPIGVWPHTMSPSNQNRDFKDGNNVNNNRSVNYNNHQNYQYGTEGSPAGHIPQMEDNNRFRPTNMHQIHGPDNKFTSTNGSNSDFQTYWSSMSNPSQGLCYQPNLNSSQPSLNNGQQPFWSNLPTQDQSSCSMQNSNSNQNTIVDRRLVFNQQLFINLNEAILKEINADVFYSVVTVTGQIKSEIL